MDPSLIPIFRPRAVVVIGVSTSSEKLGYGVARNLVCSGYSGRVHFVGQKPGELFGRRVCTEISQLPEPADLAILIVPPDVTPAAIEACGRFGIRAATIMSSGFREASTEGAELENACLQIARAHGMRLLGPNCIGMIDTHLPLDTTFLQPPMPAPGPIGFISQSGAFCAAIIDWSRSQGFGFSQIVSLGNQADVNETDVLTALAEDENTQVIVMYMESVSDGKRFVEAARHVTPHKPVIALKVGRYESGIKAAASHTGALAASDTAFDAAFEKAGILRADSAEQMFDWAQVLERYPHGLRTARRHPSTDRRSGVAVLTNAGGPGVIAADALEENGLSLAALSEATRRALVAHLPPAASVFNPVDMLASASPDTYARCLELLREDDNVEGLLVILPPPPMFKAEDIAKKIVESAGSGDKSLDLKEGCKPILISLMGASLVENALSVFNAAGLAVFPFPERAASAMGALVKRAEIFHRESIKDIEQRRRFQFSAIRPSQDELLAAYGIEMAPQRQARGLQEAVSIADELGYPIVLKIASPDIVHKSDVGGVIVNIADVASLQLAYTQMMEEVGQASPQARIDGVQIQRQIVEGQEVIVGAVRNPHFGPLVMFGSGGTEVEGLKDVSFALAPLTPSEAWKMIRKTWAGRKLSGFRHIPPADEESVMAVLINLSHLIMEQPSIDEIEINPLRVLSKGAIALDVRVKDRVVMA